MSLESAAGPAIVPAARIAREGQARMSVSIRNDQRRSSSGAPSSDTSPASSSSPETPSSSTSSALRRPRSPPSFAFPVKTETRSILKSCTHPRAVCRDQATAEQQRQALSPDRLLPHPPTPPRKPILKPKEDSDDDEGSGDESDDEPSPVGHTRSVRFKPRVRISSGTHRAHDMPTISHSSSFSSSSSVSAPLRPAAEEHIRPEPFGKPRSKLPIDAAFTAADFEAWLSKSGLNHAYHSGPIDAWKDTAEETTALLAHRRRRKPFRDSTRGPPPPSPSKKKGPPNYTVVNTGLARSPAPSPVMMKPKPYGSVGTSREDDDDDDDQRSVSISQDSESKAHPEHPDAGLLGAWKAGWNGGWQKTQSWWTTTKRVLCCAQDDALEPDSPDYLDHYLHH